MIEKWDEQFEQHILEKGKRHVLNFHVRNLAEEDGKFSTTIPGNVPADVRIKFENNQIKWMRCNCILAKSGKNCEHMAALLYMLEVRELAEEENLTEFDIISQWRIVEEQMKAEGSFSSVRDVKRAYEKHLTASEKRAKEVQQQRQKERKKVETLRKRADYILDTSTMLTRELKIELNKIFVENKEFKNIYVTILSFGFKYGIPSDADLVFDVRFLPNPYYVEGLRYKNGNDKEIQDYVLQYKEAHEFLDKLEDMLQFLIPNYIIEGKNQLVISVGCTGGKHRSVTLANELYKRLEKNKEYGIKIEHRDIDKDAKRK